jgi:hypothetical protein
MRHHQGNLHGKNVKEYQNVDSNMWKNTMLNLQHITTKEDLQEINNKFKKEKVIQDKKNLQTKREKYNEKRRQKRQAERNEKKVNQQKKVKIDLILL